MNWEVMYKNNGITNVQSGTDPFTLLSGWCNASRTAGFPTARVSMTVQTSAEYGALKVSATVSIDCPQDERSMNMASEMAFRKAVEFVNSGASVIGAPGLPNA